VARGRIRIHQDLTIVDLRHRGRRLDVAVATPSGRQERIRFEYADEDALGRVLTICRRWMHSLTRVTYVAHSRRGALIDERALFEQAFGPPDLLTW
jgi:hypothetical protein